MAIGLFLLFPLGCTGTKAGPETCTSVAGITYRVGVVMPILWGALFVALGWLGVKKMRERRRG